jgi:drug/metabolite transporter (DMT)-like permease
MNLQPSFAPYKSTPSFTSSASAKTVADGPKVTDPKLNNSQLNETARTVARRNEDRPVLATMYFLLYSFLYTANFVSAAYLYRNNPGLGSFQLLYVRSIIATLSIVFWLRGDLKRITWDEIQGTGHNGALTFRACQSAWSNMIKTASSKYISLLMISILANLGPPITAAMAYYHLGEGMRVFEVIIMILQVCLAMSMMLVEK